MRNGCVRHILIPELTIVTPLIDRVLTEVQVVALEKAKIEKEAHGELESEHPGYCGAQNTFHVGHMKGGGRLYQSYLYRHLRQGRLRQALRSQDTDHGG